MTSQFESLDQFPLAEPVLHNSIGRMIERYFAPLTKKPFEYLGVTYTSKDLALSPTIFRDFKCLPNCGACCRNVTLEFLSSGEEIPEAAKPYLKTIEFEFDGRTIQLLQDDQSNNPMGDFKCKHLDRSDGRCSIHPYRGMTNPMNCDSFPLKVHMFTREDRPNLFLSGHYSRPHTFTQLDGTKGVKCYYTELTDENTQSVIQDQLRRLDRLKQWADYFGLDTWIPEIREWIASGPHYQPLVLKLESLSASNGIEQ